MAGGTGNQVASSTGPGGLPRVPGVVVKSGAIAFTRMPWSASSSAMVRVKLFIPALQAA